MAAKKNTVDEYIDELKKMVELRTGKAFDPWLLPQLRATAMGMMMLDKIQDKLADSEITILMTGSMGQQKTEVNPLLDKYINFQRTLISQFQALGLNYNTAKGKVGGAAGDDGEDDDPVLAALTKK